MVWLEPLVEVEDARGQRIAYGPVTPERVPAMVKAGLFDAAPHELRIGRVEDLPWFAQQERLTFARVGVIDPVSIDDYIAHGGFAGLKRALALSGAEIVHEVLESGLRGRGGAAFPTGIKWRTVLEQHSPQKYVVCNADEGDSGTFSDRMLMEGDPLCLVEGMAIAGIAVGANQGYIYLRCEYPHAAHALREAIAAARERGFLGPDVCGSGKAFELEVRMGAGAYICGEETALLESLEGKKGQPRFKPPFPASFGLYGKPTTINNTETFAAVPWIINNGGVAYLECGKPNNGGTKIYSVSGDVELPGNYEVPMGTPFSKLLELAGGVRKGRQLKAVIPGGSSAPVLPADIMMQCTMDYDSIAKAGSMLGSGAVIVMDDSRSMVESLKRLSYFYMHESCGQCTPCREGTGWLWRVVDRIHNGHGKASDMDLLNSVADNIQGRTICALGDAAAMPVRAMIKHFRHEFEALIPGYVPKTAARA
jgi:NADH-quinone oxidoreductase subunit F